MTGKNNLTPCKAIHQFCIDCMGSQKGPRICENEECPLFIYRLGTNPKRKGIGGNRQNSLKRHSTNISSSQVTKISERKASSERKKAKVKLACQIRNGNIIRPTICQICKKPHKIIQGHHTDYNKPLQVIFCCPSCHKLIHSRSIECIEDIEVIRNRIGIMIDDKKKVRIIVEDVE